MDIPGSVIAAMKARASWRSYNDEPLRPEDRDRLTAFAASPPASPFGNAVRLAVVGTAADDNRGPARAFGTYGVVAGARDFLVGAVRRGPMDLEDFGFAFEYAVLYATALGLGTCWLGATFTHAGFARAIALAADEVLPAVSPVGYAAGRRTAVDRVTRWGARSSVRKPWGRLFFDGSFAVPLTPEAAGPYAEPLEMVRLAPSASNRQPWRLVRAGVVFHLFLSRTPGYNARLINVPGGDLQRLDMGIALCHFTLAAAELGLPGSWRIAEPPRAAGALPPRASYVASWGAA
jgi:hypothetical protein